MRTAIEAEEMSLSWAKKHRQKPISRPTIVRFFNLLGDYLVEPVRQSLEREYSGWWPVWFWLLWDTFKRPVDVQRGASDVDLLKRDFIQSHFSYLYEPGKAYFDARYGISLSRFMSHFGAIIFNSSKGKGSVSNYDLAVEKLKKVPLDPATLISFRLAEVFATSENCWYSPRDYMFSGKKELCVNVRQYKGNHEIKRLRYNANIQSFLNYVLNTPGVSIT